MCPFLCSGIAVLYTAIYRYHYVTRLDLRLITSTERTKKVGQSCLSSLSKVSILKFKAVMICLALYQSAQDTDYIIHLSMSYTWSYQSFTEHFIVQITTHTIYIYNKCGNIKSHGISVETIKGQT